MTDPERDWTVYDTITILSFLAVALLLPLAIIGQLSVWMGP